LIEETLPDRGATRLSYRGAHANTKVLLIQIAGELALDVLDERGGVQRVILVDPRDLGLLSDDAGIPRERPFAAILGCSDARVPVELIFNEGQHVQRPSRRTFASLRKNHCEVPKDCQQHA
jgi:hypothetical protein